MIISGISGGPLATLLLAVVPEMAKKPHYIRMGMSVAIYGLNMMVLNILHPTFRLIKPFRLSGI